MHIFMNQSIALSNVSTIHPADIPLEIDKDLGPGISARILSRQIKHAVLMLMRELLEQILRNLERELLQRNTSAWAISFSVSLTLFMCIDELQATVASENETGALEIDLEVDDAPLRIITLIFHAISGTHRKTGINPLKNGFPQDAGLQWSEDEKIFIVKIRKIIIDYSESTSIDAHLPTLRSVIRRPWSS